MGVRITAERVTAGATVERLVKAERRVRQLKASGMVRPRFSVIRLRCIYMALIRPVWTYSLHPTPFNEEFSRRADAVIDGAVQWLFPKLAKHSRRRFRRLLGLEDPDVTRQLQLRGMLLRIQQARTGALASGSMAEVVATTFDAQMVSSRLEEEAFADLPKEVQVERWRQLEDSRARRRKVAVARAIEPHPLWSFPSKRHAVCAANWTVGRFTPSRAAAKWYLGGARYLQGGVE